MTLSLELAYDHCRAVTRERARNFYYGLRLTPQPRRSALYAIYAWSRLGDDITDQALPLEERARQLDTFRAHTMHTCAGDPPSDDPIWIALAETLSRYPLEADWFVQMLNGFEHDLRHAPFQSDAQLWLYCDQVAGTVGRMCISVWGLAPGADRAHALELASLRGRAFQLTNILRDFAEDYDQARVYLPDDRLRHHALTPADLRAWSNPAACSACIRSLANEAASAFAASAPLEGMIASDCRAVLWAMSEIYRGILAQIQQSPRRVVVGRASLSPVRKASIAARAALLSQWWQTTDADRAGASA